MPIKLKIKGIVITDDVLPLKSVRKNFIIENIWASSWVTGYKGLGKETRWKAETAPYAGGIAKGTHF